MSEAMRAQVRPPSSCPAKSAFFAIEGYGSDGVFDGVGVHLNTAISQEDLQAIPVPMDVGELLAETRFGGDTAALLGQLEAEVSNQRGRLFRKLPA